MITCEEINTTRNNKKYLSIKTFTSIYLLLISHRVDRVFSINIRFM